MNKAIKDVINGFRMYPIWLHQAYYYLASKYKRTMLGSLWIAGNFIFLSIAITIVFGILFHRDLKMYLPYVMLGNLSAVFSLWTLSEAPNLFLSSAAMIKNHAYPFTYFVFEDVMRVLMLLGHNMIVFYLFMIINGTLAIPDWTLLIGMPIDIVILLTWGTVIGMFSARFRDLRFLLPSLATPLFFLTPVYWHVSELGPEHMWIANINPLYAMISMIREPIMGLQPTMTNWSVALGLMVSGLALWLLCFPAFRRRIPFWV